MKRLLFISILFQPLLIFAQVPLGADSSSPVMEYVYQNLGKKIGTGICYDFVEHALNTKYKDWTNDYYSREDSMQIHQIAIEEVREGDVIILESIVFNDSVKSDLHIGIVCKKEDNTICYASQNVSDDSSDKFKKVSYRGGKYEVFKNSKVQYDFINIDKIISGDIYVFRF